MVIAPESASASAEQIYNQFGTCSNAAERSKNEQSGALSLNQKFLIYRSEKDLSKLNNKNESQQLQSSYHPYSTIEHSTTSCGDEDKHQMQQLIVESRHKNLRTSLLNAPQASSIITSSVDIRSSEEVSVNGDIDERSSSRDLQQRERDDSKLTPSNRKEAIDLNMVSIKSR